MNKLSLFPSIGHKMYVDKSTVFIDWVFYICINTERIGWILNL